MILAVFDLPHGAVRRPLTNGEALSPQRREAVEAAVRAVLAGPQASAPEGNRSAALLPTSPRGSNRPDLVKCAFVKRK